MSYLSYAFRPAANNEGDHVSFLDVGWFEECLGSDEGQFRAILDLTHVVIEAFVGKLGVVHVSQRVDRPHFVT